MRRLHLFEWEDQTWLPTVFRDFVTDHLRYTLNEPMRHPINVEIAKRLKTLLERVRSRQLVDLCAGSGGPLLKISRILADDLAHPVEIVLTDYFPNVAAFRRIESESHGTIKGCFEPISALDVPSELTGVRTLFTALHHFEPERARVILSDAVRKRAAIAVFEPLERTVRMVGLVGLMSFLRGFTHTPVVGNMSALRLFFTYVVPLAPAIFAWDGMVSAIRTYTPNELSQLATSVGTADYEWESGRFEVAGPYGSMPTTYLIGFPRT
jgi:hypothetical protein